MRARAAILSSLHAMTCLCRYLQRHVSANALFQARYGWSAAAAPGPRLSAAAERAAAAALRGRAALMSPAAAFGAAGLGAWEAGVRTAAHRSSTLP